MAAHPCSRDDFQSPVPTRLDVVPKGPAGLRTVALPARSVLAGALMTLLAAPALALEGDPLQLTAATSLTYDDNLARTSSSRPALSDEIATAQAGVLLHLLNSRQVYDANASVLRAAYNHNGSQDYTASNLSLGGATDIGNAVHVNLGVSQQQSLAPLNNFVNATALVRDVVTTRRVTGAGSYGLDSRFSLDANASATRLSNDNAALAYNDNEGRTGSLGLSYNLPEGSKLGVRGIYSRANYPNLVPLLTPSGPGALYDPSYVDHRVEVFGSLSLTPITTVSGSVAQVNRSYRALPGQGTNSQYGRIGFDTASGGPLSFGAEVHRDIGGEPYLASRIVYTDGVQLHTRYEYSALLSASAKVDLTRQRYSVDSPGYPAHREYDTRLSLGVDYAPLSYLRLRGEALMDWRHANPSYFGYIDRRYVVTASLTL